MNYHFDLLVLALLLSSCKIESDYGDDQGEVFIQGKKREGLISDEEVSISGLRIGLVIFCLSYDHLLVWLCNIYGC